MYFDRFDICHAYHEYLVHWHDGQTSPEYARLCALRGWFDPGMAQMSQNARNIYSAIVEREHGARIPS
jgi:hypothetical protein